MTLAAKKIFEEVYLVNNHIATKNLVAGEKVYGEELVKISGTEYRWWNPYRSKIAAAIKNGLKEFPVKPESKILYLGSAEGTTISHLSDITGDKGLIFGVDINAKTMQKFLYLCEKRKNLLPILADANRPETLKEYLQGTKVDVLCQDVSQKNQAEIFLKNARMYLKPSGKGLLSVKARSISQTKTFKQIVKNEEKKLENEFSIIQTIDLNPFETDHAMVFCEKK